MHGQLMECRDCLLYTSTSEAVQVSVEGVEQLEIYFGKYLPQFFYSMLAPITLFAVLSFINLKSAVLLLICVPVSYTHLRCGRPPECGD